MRASIRPIALVLVALWLSGCAARHGGSLAGRFVREGTPALDYGGLPLEPSTAKAPALKAAGSMPAKPRAASFGATIESSDQRLAAALLFEMMSPTPEAHFQVAEEYRRLGIFDAAADRLARALHKQPRLAAAHESLARIWRDWGMPDRALGPAHRATFHDAQSASAHNTLGTVLAAAGSLEAAHAAFERALSLHPGATWALNNLCYVQFQLGRFPDARASCEAALAIDPGLVAARNNLALAHAAAGDMGQAGEVFRAAGDAAAAQYNLGIVQLANRDYGSAVDSFERAIKERPAFTAARARARQARRALTGSD